MVLIPSTCHLSEMTLCSVYFYYIARFSSVSLSAGLQVFSCGSLKKLVCLLVFVFCVMAFVANKGYDY